MSIDKSKLESFLKDIPLVEDEKKMWIRVGFYIEAVPSQKDTLGYVTAHRVVSNTGVSSNLPSLVAKDMRLAVIDWWQSEKVKPRSLEVPVDVSRLSELENRNG